VSTHARRVLTKPLLREDGEQGHDESESQTEKPQRVDAASQCRTTEMVETCKLSAGCTIERCNECFRQNLAVVGLQLLVASRRELRRLYQPKITYASMMNAVATAEKRPACAAMRAAVGMLEIGSQR